MTDLLEGHKYSLSTDNKSNKSILFVKLTDSFVECIETFLNTKDDLQCKPSIQFQNNNGVISVPLKGEEHKYEFTLSDIEGDGQSSFQCLHNIDDSSLESLGSMLMKMTIHATEDSYEKTKSKMTAADQEQKNSCTKELKQNVSRLGHKMNLKRPSLMYIPEQAHPVLKKSEPVKLDPKNKITSPSSIIQQPIRDRIIHILAAKSYKKPELLLRLKREGIKDKDKEQFNEILLGVAKMKGNIFVLENHIWNEVNENWEFCSEEELKLIKKRKQQFLNSKNVGQSNNKNEVPTPSKPSVKQGIFSSNLTKTNMNGNSDSGIQSMLQKYQTFKPALNGDAFLSTCKKSNKVNGSDVSSHSIASFADSNPEFDFSEIQLKYPKVESVEQRYQYVKDFNADYEEYLQLHDEMKAISEKFSEMFHELQTYGEGSPEFKRAKVMIAKEYKKALKDNSYVPHRKRFELLVAKLSHIRRLISEFDDSNNKKFS